MSADVVLIERDGPIATLTLNRPDKLNALNAAVLDAMVAAVDELVREGQTRCAIVTGAGEKAFAAGADIAEMQELSESEALAFSQKGHAVGDALAAAPFPSIGAVNGFALGGGMELALACDFIHASTKAKFGQPEVKLGVIPGFGGTSRLARRVGIAMARELVYSGAMIRADEALRIGLVNRLHEPDALMGAVRELATGIAAMGPLAVAGAKRSLCQGEERLLAEANAIESKEFARCFTTADQREGMSAFVEKRAAAFKGE